jgi:hypothetical protein
MTYVSPILTKFRLRWSLAKIPQYMKTVSWKSLCSVQQTDRWTDTKRLIGTWSQPLARGRNVNWNKYWGKCHEQNFHRDMEEKHWNSNPGWAVSGTKIEIRATRIRSGGSMCLTARILEVYLHAFLGPYTFSHCVAQHFSYLLRASQVSDLYTIGWRVQSHMGGFPL